MTLLDRLRETELGRGNIRIAQMKVDTRYQRLTDTIDSKRKIAIMAQSWNPSAVGRLEVSFRNGHYWVIDGGHRLEAARKIGLETLPCTVHIDLTIEEEAKLFMLFNARRKPVSPAGIHKAAVTAGDPIAVATQEVMSRHNVPMSGRGASPATATKVVAAYGSDHLDRVIRVFKAAWPGERLKGQAMSGMALFLAIYPTVNLTELADKMGTVALKTMMQRAASIADYVGTHDRSWAKAMLLTYNSGKRSRMLPDLTEKAKA